MINQWFILFCLVYNKDKRGDILSKVLRKYFSAGLSLQIFDYINELFNQDTEVDLNLLLSKFGKDSYVEITKKFKYLQDNSINTEHYEEYIQNLRNEFVKDSIKNFVTSWSNNKDIKETVFVDDIDSLLNDLSGSHQASSLTTAEESLNKFISGIDKDSNTIDGLSTGIEDLDLQLDGLKAEDYYLIAGRPSMGKSGIAGFIAQTNALAGIPTLLFSLEMSDKQIIGRMFTSATLVDTWKFKAARFRNDSENKRIKEYVEKFRQMPLLIDNTADLCVQKMRAIIQKAKVKYPNLGLVCVDYIQKMSGEGDNQNLLVGAISKQFKTIAKQYKIPVVACAQLSRACESRDNKRPELSDLRDSGSLEQDADVVMMLYRDYYYNPNPEHKNICEILIRKFRNGETGKVVVEYDLGTQAFKTIKPNTQLFNLAKKFYYE